MPRIVAPRGSSYFGLAALSGSAHRSAINAGYERREEALRRELEPGRVAPTDERMFDRPWDGPCWQVNIPPEVFAGARTAREIQLRAQSYAEIEQIIELSRAPSGRTGWRTHYRFVVSFPPHLHLTNRQIRKALERFLKKHFPEARAMISVHGNRPHVHAHVWLHARLLDGSKINLRGQDYLGLNAGWDDICCEFTGYPKGLRAEVIAETAAAKRAVAEELAGSRARGEERAGREVARELGVELKRYPIYRSERLSEALARVDHASVEYEGAVFSARSLGLSSEREAAQPALDVLRTHLRDTVVEAARTEAPEDILRLIGPAGWTRVRALVPLERQPWEKDWEYGRAEPPVREEIVQEAFFSVPPVRPVEPAPVPELLGYAALPPAVRACIDMAEICLQPPSGEFGHWDIDPVLVAAPAEYVNCGGYLRGLEVLHPDKCDRLLRQAYFRPSDARARLESHMEEYGPESLKAWITEDPARVGALRVQPADGLQRLLAFADPSESARRLALEGAAMAAELFVIRGRVDEYRAQFHAEHGRQRLRRNPAELGRAIERLSRGQARQFWRYLRQHSAADQIRGVASSAVLKAREQVVRGPGRSKDGWSR